MVQRNVENVANVPERERFSPSITVRRGKAGRVSLEAALRGAR